MGIEIPGGGPPANKNVYTRTQKTGSKEGSREAAEKTEVSVDKTSDNVNISSMTVIIEELKNAINQLPDSREEKIQAIKQAIADGSYQVDPAKILKKMFE